MMNITKNWEYNLLLIHDGNSIKEIDKSDVILLSVSRTSKTPNQFI